LARADRSHRQPPQGVTRGVWRYVHAEHIARQYDDYFAQNRLFQFDSQVLARHFSRPGLVVDLGCGTGRSLIPLARRSFRGLGVDLSLHMLRIVQHNARLENLPIACVRANLVQLDALRSRSADYCICMFSTLGMIRGRDNRQQMLAHAHRILKPAGLFVVHVHNLWYNLLNPEGRRWLAKHLVSALIHRSLELGDKRLDYRGIPDMFLHTFTRRELLRGLASAGFRLVELIPLHAGRHRPLPCPWFLGWLRANGWIAVCRK